MTTQGHTSHMLHSNVPESGQSGPHIRHERANRSDFSAPLATTTIDPLSMTHEPPQTPRNRSAAASTAPQRPRVPAGRCESKRSRRKQRDDSDDAQAIDQPEERAEAALLDGAAGHLQLGSTSAAIAAQPRLVAAPEGDAHSGAPAGRMTINDRPAAGGTTHLDGRIGRAPQEMGPPAVLTVGREDLRAVCRGTTGRVPVGPCFHSGEGTFAPEIRSTSTVGKTSRKSKGI